MFKCEKCGKEFKTKNHLKNHLIWKHPELTPEYKEFRKKIKNKISKSLKGKKFTEEHKRKLSTSHKGKIPWNKGLPSELQPFYGKHHSEEIMKKRSESYKGKKDQFGEKNPNYQLDWNKLKKPQKHRRMIKIIPKPKTCPICGKKRKLGLTNLDHNYSQNINEWKWKCYSCHIQYDNRFKVKIYGLSTDMEDFMLEQLDHYENNKTKFWTSFYKTCVELWTEGVDLSDNQLNIIEREYNKIKEERLAEGI